MKLTAAVAPQRLQHIPGETAGVYPHHRWLFRRDFTQNQGHIGIGVHGRFIGVTLEETVRGRKSKRRYTVDKFLGTPSITNEVCDTDQLEAMRRAEIF